MSKILVNDHIIFILCSTETNLADGKYVNFTITAMNYYMQRCLFGCQDGEVGRRLCRQKAERRKVISVHDEP